MVGGEVMGLVVGGNSEGSGMPSVEYRETIEGLVWNHSKYLLQS